MKFNPSKCQIVHVTGSTEVYGQGLESVTCAKHLGVNISSDLTWNYHVDCITEDANRTLGFICRNIKTKLSRVRETAYITHFSGHSLSMPQLYRIHILTGG